jgi:hypothetical protein
MLFLRGKINNMKFQSIFFISIMAIIFSLILITPVNADVMPPGMKAYERCVSISNLNNYTDVVFVGYITGPVIQCENPYIINSSECLTQFYKANKLTIYAIEKDYFDSKGLDNIDFESDSNTLPYTFDFNVEWDYEIIANPLTREELYYSVAGFNDTALILYEERKVSSYGSAVNKEETYDKPEIPDMRSVINESKAIMENNNSKGHDMELQENTKINNSLNETLPSEPAENRSGINSILCFFKKLFGNDC